MSDEDTLRAALRWRLLLGPHAEAPLPVRSGGSDDGTAAERDRVLGWLYDREHASRGHRRAGLGTGEGLAIPAWLKGVRTLFPREAVEVLERDALVRYGLRELVTDPEILRSLEPNLELVGVILAMKDQMSTDVRAEARRIVREVCDALGSKLRLAVEPALTGASDPSRTRAPRTFRNADWNRTIRRNLKNYDSDARRLVADRIAFRHRQRARPAWRIVIAVDQSGSMAEGLVHAAITAAILASVPSVSVNLVLWDDRCVDLSDKVSDPLEVLLASQLGGGTNLYPALRYCADLVTEPERTVLAVISDWFVYDAVEPSLALARELATEGVRCFGFCSLGTDARSAYDERFARRLADAGWWVGAVTPRQMAEQIGRLLG
jgi:hypothetical protein